MLNMTPTCGMPNPKKNNVRYARRIPFSMVKKMDERLDALRAEAAVAHQHLDEAIAENELLSKRDHAKNYLKSK
jgi:hypothetical protein